MVKVAVAGGTGGVGSHIVDAILATGKHDLTVLSRTANPALEARGVHVVPVSYTDPASLETALQGVHTVISTIATLDFDVWVSSQLALLAAAKKVGAKRFAPSELGPYSTDDDSIAADAIKRKVTDAVKKSGLEYTLFFCGVFTNYLAVGTKGIGHLRPMKNVIDVENCSAVIPGDGTRHVVMTRVEDVGAFIAASLDLDKWPEISSMRGDRMTWNEVIALAEKVRAQTFAVTYVPVDEMEKKSTADTGPMGYLNKTIWQIRISMATTDRFGFKDATLNDLFPNIKPVSVADFLKQWWGPADKPPEASSLSKDKLVEQYKDYIAAATGKKA